MANKGVIEIYCPADPESFRACWRTSSERPTESTGPVAWVGSFEATDSDGHTRVTFLAIGDDQGPNLDTLVHSFTKAEWDAFTAGVENNEFDY